MNNFQRFLLLLLPAFVAQQWLARRDIFVQPPPGGALARFIMAPLPFAFTAALSVRVESDRRPLKYFMPYGKMKKFVALAYNIHVGDPSLDKGLIGALRAISPYGLVLWWDGKEARMPAKARKAPLPAATPGSEATFSNHLAACDAERLDRIEALALRALLIARVSANTRTMDVT